MARSGAEAVQHRLTHKDLEYTPEDGNLYEVIDGELHVTPFPGYAHQHTVTQLTTVLNQHVRSQRLGAVFAAGLKVVLDEPTGVGPDVVYVSQAHMSHMQEDGYHGAPDLVVEVTSSKPQLDRYVKLNKYANAGVPEYWIVDPKERCLSVYRLDGNAYRHLGDFRDQNEFQPDLFPGLSIALAELWV